MVPMKKNFYPAVFSRGLRNSVSHCVSLSVCLSVGLSVPHFLFRRFWHFVSGFFITAPAQSNATEAAMYTALPTTPAFHINAPAQPPQLKPARVSGLVHTLPNITGGKPLRYPDPWKFPQQKLKKSKNIIWRVKKSTHSNAHSNDQRP